MADVELLPLPESDGLNDIYGECHHYYYADTLQAYARANMEPLRAEVDALQREVGELHMREKRAEAYAVEKVSETLKAVMARRDAEERAERLAEALREAMEWNWLDDDARPSRIGDLCDSALAQEDRNGNE